MSSERQVCDLGSRTKPHDIRMGPDESTFVWVRKAVDDHVSHERSSNTIA